jgi:acyl carrier protein
MSWKNLLKRSTATAADDSPAPPRAAVLQPVPADAALADLVHELRRHIVEFSDGKLRAEDVDAGCHLFDYGYIDSLSAVNFLALVEQDYGVRIEDAELLDQYSTLHAIAVRIRTSP